MSKGVQLHFRVDGEGEPLVVLHGLFGSLENWRSFSLAMARGWRVYTMDLRNHGGSPHCADMDLELMAEDLLEWFESYRVDSANLLGHSLGGKAAMEFALRHPARVKRLVVADIAPKEYPPLHLGILQGLLKLDLARFQTRQQMADALEPDIPELAVRQFLLKNVTRDEGGGFRWRLGLREIAANYHKLGQGIRGGRTFLEPTLFVRGERSSYLAEADLEMARRLFPAARMETLPGAGHWLHVESPEMFQQVISFFLSRAAP